MPCRLIVPLLCTVFSVYSASHCAAAETTLAGHVPSADWYKANASRIGGVVPVRKDSPAFHDELRDQEEQASRSGSFDVTAPGSMLLIKRTQQPIQNGSSFSLLGSYGSFDILHLTGSASYAAHGYGIAAGFGKRNAGTVAGGSGLRITDIYPANAPSRYRVESRSEDAFTSHNLWLKSSGGAAGSDTSYALLFARIGAGQTLYPHLKMDNDHDTSDRVEGSMRIRRPISSIKEVTLAINWRDTEATFDDRYRESARVNGILKPFSTRNEGDLLAYGVKLVAIPNVPGGTLQVGADYARRNPTATSTNAILNKTSYLIPDVVQQNAALFADYIIPIDSDLIIAAGLRGELSANDARAASGKSAPSHLEPSGFLKGTYTASSDFQLSLGLGVGIKMPDPLDLYFGVLIPTQAPLLGSPDIAPARTWHPELAATWHSSDITLNASAWYSRITNYVTVRTLSATQRYLVNSEAELWGGSADVQTAQLNGFSLRSRLSYTQGNDLDAGHPLAEVTPLTAETSVSWSNSTYFAEMSERIGSRQWRVDSTLAEQPTASWCVTDLRGGIRWKHARAIVGINNLADTRYYQYKTWFRDPLMTGVKAPEPGRVIYLSLEMTL